MQKRAEARAFYLFIAPWLAGFLLLSLAPMAYSLYASFTRWDGMAAPAFVGLANYNELLHDPLFYKSLGNTLYFAAVSVPANLTLALFLALMLNARRRGATLLRAVFYLPSVVAGVAIYVVWLRLFNTETGFINYALSRMGIVGPNWLKDPRMAMLSIIVMNLFFCGGQMLIFLAGLGDIPASYYEAARMDGAGSTTLFLRITLPLLSPVLLFNLLMGIIGALQVFAQPWVFTNGEGTPAYSTYVYAMYIFKSAFVQHRFGFAAALAWVLFLVTMALTLTVLRFSKTRALGMEGKG